MRKKRPKGGEKRSGGGAGKEDRPFNNSHTPASFRTESLAQLDPCVLHTHTHTSPSTFENLKCVGSGKSYERHGRLLKLFMYLTQ